MSGEHLLHWLRDQYPGVQAQLARDEDMRNNLRAARMRRHDALVELMDAAGKPDFSRFELDTLKQNLMLADEEVLIKEDERDLHLNQTRLNLDALMDSVIAAIRTLPQTAPVEMQERVQRRLNISIALANPTLPSVLKDKAGGEERVYARRSNVF